MEEKFSTFLSKEEIFQKILLKHQSFLPKCQYIITIIKKAVLGVMLPLYLHFYFSSLLLNLFKDQKDTHK